MKKVIPIIILLLGFTVLHGQKTVNKFIDQIKKHDRAVAMTIPGWLIRAGINLSDNGIEDQDAEEIRNLGKKIKKLRFVVVDRQHHISESEADEFLKRAKAKDGFEEYTRVRDKGTRIYVLVKEEKDKIKYLTIFSRAEDAIALINLKTDITFEDLEKAEFSFKNKENITSEIHN